MITVVVSQGCIRSTTMFLERINRFANNIDGLAVSDDELMERLDNSCNAYGMEISGSKSDEQRK